METAAAKLEALVYQASTRLDTLSFELDLKLTKKVKMQSSLVNLIQMIQNMNCELEELKQEAAALKKEQEAMKGKLVSLLPELTKKLHYLEGQTGRNKNNNNTCSILIDRLDNMNA